METVLKEVGGTVTGVKVVGVTHADDSARVEDVQVFLEECVFVAFHLSHHVCYETTVPLHKSHCRQVDCVVLEVVQIQRLHILNHDVINVK